MAYGAVSFLLENVPLLLTSHADLLSGSDTEYELWLLTSDLISLETLLEPESTRSNKATQLREVERQIKKVVYAIEDTIDACVTRLAAAAADWKNMSGCSRRDLVGPADLADLARHVRSLRKDELKPALDRLRGSGISDESRQRRGKQDEPRLKKAPSMMGDSMIDLEDEEIELIKTLIQRPYPDKIGITPLIGIAGLGKTTLAWKVYNNEEIQREFPTRIWASVSREFNPRTIFLGILHEFTSKDMSAETTSDLAKAIRASLQKRRFLLVLDDVWTAKALSTIRSALPEDNERGRVLVTTRSHKIFNQIEYYDSPQRLRFLTNDEGWRLLQFKVFRKDGQCPPQLQGLGRHISERCRGIPMLLLMIAGILMDYVSKEETSVAIVKSWIELSQSLDEYTRGGSDVFRSVLELSYDRMCDELRDCFLYLGVFPEDYEIPAWTLTRLWISEGFVRPRQGQSLEERAHENLIDLIDRNLVIIDKLKSNGDVKTCRIHDTVHDFCKVESEGKEHLFQVLTKNGDGTFIKPSQHRRICIHSNVLEFFSPEPYAPATRSFLSFSAEEISLPTEAIPKIPGAFELARVLHVKPLVFRIFPLGLTQLVLLKYVVLSSDFKVLPEAVSRLSNLLTLVIHTSSRTLAIKADIWRSMVQLRDLRTNASITLHKKPAAGENRGGQHLQTLANISPGDCTLDLFERAHHLKKLGIRGILATMNFDNLRVLNELENLKLLNDDIHDIMTPLRLPPPDKFPPKLRSLTLSATFLSWEQMSVLGMLETLEVLKLKDNAFRGRCWEVGTGGFRRLEVLHIGYTNIVSWEASDHDFPKLKCLLVRNCEELESLPQVLADVPCLETMVLHRLSKSAVASARKIQQQILQNRGDCGGGGRGIKLSIFPPYERHVKL
ncbi:NBS-LRR type resistance protein [Striga asiatica]|uniref:NBS-LRR type resistance protein n=1 Tax=Striga asiatica TaxID=4170 RepID=A0A5A7PN35_STRAF|nr:NBS-LRR type resistance protein [Striga asiatica]